MRWWLPYRTSVCSFKTNCNGMIFSVPPCSSYNSICWCVALFHSATFRGCAAGNGKKDSWTNRSIVLNCFEGEKLTEKTHTFVQKSNKKRRKSTAINFIIIFFCSLWLCLILMFSSFSSDRICVTKKNWNNKTFPIFAELFVIFQSHSVHNRKMEHKPNLEHFGRGN